jgi:hypothetical protein
MLVSDTNQKALVKTCNYKYIEKFNFPYKFEWALKFLVILHQTHSDSPFYQKMNSVNTRSIPNYPRCTPSYTIYSYIPKVSEMLSIKIEYRKCCTRHNPMARVNTICILIPHRSAHITVGMKLVQESRRSK